MLCMIISSGVILGRRNQVIMIKLLKIIRRKLLAKNSKNAAYVAHREAIKLFKLRKDWQWLLDPKGGRNPPK